MNKERNKSVTEDVSHMLSHPSLPRLACLPSSSSMLFARILLTNCFWAGRGCWVRPNIQI